MWKRFISKKKLEEEKKRKKAEAAKAKAAAKNKRGFRGAVNKVAVGVALSKPIPKDTANEG